MNTSLDEQLLNKSPVHFTGPTIYAIPEESGIYLLSHRSTGEALYVGHSKVGIRKRMKDHWNGTWDADLGKELLKDGTVQNKKEARNYIKAHVDIRWMTGDELDIDISRAEYLAIRALRPRFNKQFNR